MKMKKQKSIMFIMKGLTDAWMNGLLPAGKFTFTLLAFIILKLFIILVR